MKRQRNTTQMKEQTRDTEVQMNEEEIGKHPEKRIQNNDSKDDQKPWNKMEKMQEWINKDIGELKNKHTEINNTITEIKNTLEGLNSRISEAEEQISELEDKMVEITSEEQNENKKNEKSWGQTQRPLGPYQTHQHLNYRGPRKRREKERVWENFWRDYSWKFP